MTRLAGAAKRLLSVVRPYLLIAMIAIVCWSMTTNVALAKKKRREAPPTPESQKEYVMPYAIVMFSIILGVMVVCRPSKRADQPPELTKPKE